MHSDACLHETVHTFDNLKQSNVVSEYLIADTVLFFHEFNNYLTSPR